MSPVERQRSATRWSMRLSRARAVDPIEQLARLVFVFHAKPKRSLEAARQMRPWLDLVGGTRFAGADLAVIECAGECVRLHEVKL